LEQRLKRETIEKFSNQTLGDILKEIAGVSSLKIWEFSGEASYQWFVWESSSDHNNVRLGRPRMGNGTCT
jgi:hypothetical protein